jgi:hypothetical protein
MATATTPAQASDLDPLDRVALEAFLSPTTMKTATTISPTLLSHAAAQSNGEISGRHIQPSAQL